MNRILHSLQSRCMAWRASATRVVLLALLLVVESAAANTQDFFLNVKRSSRYLFQNAQVSIYPPHAFANTPQGYVGVTWFCSGNSIQNGICDNNRIVNGGYAWSIVQVELTERQSQIKQIVKLSVGIFAEKSGTTVRHIRMNDAAVLDRNAQYRELAVRIDDTVYGRLQGGIWEAQLWFWAWKADDSAWFNSGDVKVNLRITVDDADNAQVIFMDGKTSSISSEVSLHDPGGAGDRLAGHKDWDICLYDGFGMYADAYEILATSAGTDGAGYALRHGENPVGAAGTIPYTGYVSTRSGRRALSAQPMVLGRSDLNFKTVVVPSMGQQATYCGEATLTLDISSFAVKEKRAGVYTDDLALVFRKSSSAL